MYNSNLNFSGTEELSSKVEESEINSMISNFFSSQRNQKFPTFLQETKWINKKFRTHPSRVNCWICNSTQKSTSTYSPRKTRRNVHDASTEEIFPIFSEEKLEVLKLQQNIFPKSVLDGWKGPRCYGFVFCPSENNTRKRGNSRFFSAPKMKLTFSIHICFTESLRAN